MPTDIPLRCACGALAGTALEVSPRKVCRIICYCDDCQAYARFLGRPDILDQWGGTDIFQVAPATLRLSGKMDDLCCVRLSDKGLHRWYCGACRTPIGNTSPRIPFVGVVHTFRDHGGGGDGDGALGAPLAAVQTKFAVGTPPPRGTLLKVAARSVKLLGKWWLTGAGSPSPFFEDQTRAPRVPPRILRPEERRAL